jgi:hypothetical protein
VHATAGDMAETFKDWRNRAGPYKLGGDTLLEALEAVASEPEHYPFRLNRELVDLEARFVCFVYGGVVYVGKSGPDHDLLRERDNARKASQALSGPRLVPLVPHFYRTLKRSWLVTEYLGRSLHEEFIEDNLEFTEAQFWDLIAELDAAGVTWAGFAPRNLVRGPRGLIYALDWEDASFSKTPVRVWDRLTHLKTALNWGQILGGADKLFISFSARGREMSPEIVFDEFERSLHDLFPQGLSPEKVVSLGQAVTVGSEGSAANGESQWLTPQETGHLISDTLSSPLDVLYAALATEVSRLNPPRFACLLKEYSQRVDQALNAEATSLQEVRRISAELIFHLAYETVPRDVQEAAGRSSAALIAQHEGLVGKKGYAASLQRSACCRYILSIVFCACARLFDWDAEGLQLLLRGSLAQNVMSSRSDVDFEISSPAYPRGFRPAEHLLSGLLRWLGMASEGSDQRPAEQDVGDAEKWTRDACEWLELSSIDGNAEWPFVDLQREDQALLGLGTFEAGGLVYSTKSMWQAARSLLARTSIVFQCPHPQHELQIASISSRDGQLGAAFRNLIEEAIIAYELDDDVQLEDLERKLKEIGAKTNLPTPIFLRQVSKHTP